MALNSSGPISLGGNIAGQSINLELGQASNQQVSLNDTNVRTLAGITTPNSPITMPVDFWGKSAGFSMSYVVVGGGGSGGGGYLGGGGGGGGVVIGNTGTIADGGNLTYTITVGTGGAGGSSTVFNNGGNSSIVQSTANISVTAVGGGAGSADGLGGAISAAGNGGSGGGGTPFNPTGGTGTAGQGGAGGNAFPTLKTVNYLVVGGGGGGGAYNGGGGGAGGLRSSVTNTGGGGSLESPLTISTSSSYVVTVGAGGAGQITSTQSLAGSNSSFSTITALGGGKGGGYTGSFYNASSGGSGGGAGYAISSAGTGTVNQGFGGGTGSNPEAAGGGGGAGGAGANATTAGGNGGVGVAVAISGTSTFYAGGGGGASYPGGGGTGGGTGGNGGGGNGGFNSSGTAGSTNTGGGGGGSQDTTTPPNNPGGNGGSGVVIVSYDGDPVFAGGTITSAGGNTIHTFNSSGILGQDLNITNSLRFRASVNSYLGRTPSVTGNQKTWTWSGWVKRGAFSAGQNLFGASNDNYASTYFSIFFNSPGAIRIQNVTGGVADFDNSSQSYYLDVAAWYHIVVAIDTTQSVASNRVKLWVNGVQVTAFSPQTYPTQNSNTYVNSNAYAHTISGLVGSSFDGYMAEINFIDGQALTPSSFGYTDSNGVWVPMAYGGTYGTNGFRLPFNSIALTSGSNTGLGRDTSGNGNYWTTNNISVTPGATYDAMTDAPQGVNSSIGNYSTLNSLTPGSNFVLADGGLRATRTTSTVGYTVGTIGMSSGKWYAEFLLNQNTTGVNWGVRVGITDNINANPSSQPTNSYYYQGDGNKVLNGSSTSYAATYAVGDIIGVTYDADAGTLSFYKNNVAQGSVISGISGVFYFSVASSTTNAGTIEWISNFGQQPCTYTPPTGFSALQTYNLSTPTIQDGRNYFDALIYAGSASNQTISGLSFTPDFIWFKERTTGGIPHNLFDSLRSNYGSVLESNSTSAASASNAIVSVSPTGYTLLGGVSTTNDAFGRNYVTWNWRANGTGVTNTAGTITSTVSANPTSGFSIVTYTGPGAGGGTVGHGLGTAPAMVIVKNRSATESWRVGHSGINGGSSPWNYYLNLNDNSAQVSSSSVWNNTAPTASVFTIANDTAVSGSGNSLVAYCFAPIAGYSAMGTYVGNGSSDGPFVYLGFRPAYVLIRRTDDVASWIVQDTARSPYNTVDAHLIPNATNAESQGLLVDYNSNGFKIRVGLPYTDYNISGGTYIYMAFAENPFKYANAR